MSTLNLNNALLAGLAEKIVSARKMHGTDSSYAIGLLASLDWLLDGSDSFRQELNERVLEIESGKIDASPKPSAEPPQRSRGDSELAENSWIKGSVKWFNNDKGYGFISTDSDTDVFVHWRDISSWDRSLAQGDEVEFMVTKTAKGFQAINVMKGEQEGKEKTETSAEDEGAGKAEDDGGEEQRDRAANTPAAATVSPVPAELGSVEGETPSTSTLEDHASGAQQAEVESDSGASESGDATSDESDANVPSAVPESADSSTEAEGAPTAGDDERSGQ